MQGYGGVPAHMFTIDIEKAYDTVPFALIKHMLQQYNCPPQTLQLLMEMHTKRALRFKIEGHIGSPIKPQRGVAQGSPLSCILFVLCMQPLLKRLQTTGSGLWGAKDDVAYVDDLTLLAPTASDLEQKWGVVREFELWSGMRINIAKCEYDTTEADPEKWGHTPRSEEYACTRERCQCSESARVLAECRWRQRRPNSKDCHKYQNRHTSHETQSSSRQPSRRASLI